MPIIEDSPAEIMRLPVDCDAAAASGLLNNCRSLIERAAGAVVDAGDVARITTPCLQILLALRADCAARGVHFSIGAASPAFLLACGDLGAPDLDVAAGPDMGD